MLRAFGIFRSTLVCYHLSLEVLETHKGLTKDDITYAANIICTAYGGKYIETQGVVLLLLYLCKTRYTGRFALIFGSKFDRLVRERKSEALFEIITRNLRGEFVEVYHNPRLSPENRKNILDILYREYTHIYNIFIEAQELKTPLGKTRFLSQEERSWKCFHDTSEEQGGLQEFPGKIWFTDKPPASHHYYIYGVETFKLLAALAHSEKINPISQQPFDKVTYAVLETRLRKELHMYMTYLERRE